MCDMSVQKENSPDSMEHACVLCRRVEADPKICGAKLEREGICAHEFCAYFANKAFHQGAKRVRFVGFIPEDIEYIIKWAEEKQCFVCGNFGATITCWETGCERTFHLPCATEGGCITQYFEGYRSFCWEHRPEQAVEAAPDKNTTCLICLDPVGDAKSYSTMVCPVCQHAWFHRGCIQAHAFHRGFLRLSCPHCQNRYEYRKAMLTMGIRIPDSPPSSDNDGEDEEVNERQRRCGARECLYPGGREQAEREGPWQLLLCSSCGAEGTHRHCSSVSSSRTSWECNGCAGLGTASCASPQLAGPSTAGQAEAWPSCGSPTPRTSSPSTRSQAVSGPSCSSPAFQSGRCSNPPGPERRQNRSRLQRQAQIPYSRPRGGRARSRGPGPTEESSPSGQAGLRLSHSSPATRARSPSTTRRLPSRSSSGSPARQRRRRSRSSGPVRTRERSRAQRRAQTPYSRPRRRRSSSRARPGGLAPDPPPPAQ